MAGRSAPHGWTPRRELVLAFWGAEEFGAVGSTEFVESHRDWLARHAVAYMNVDVLTAGSLDVSGSPSLGDLAWSAALEVRDPLEGGSLADGWLARQTTASPAADGAPARPILGVLGVGSDWTAFFHHAGVPSLQWTMNGRGTYSVYHSALDDLDYLRTHADSALLHTPQMARVMGLAALRLAEADALPFDYEDYASRIQAMADSAIARHAGPLPAEEVAAVQDAIGELAAAAAAVAGRRRRALARGDTVFLRRTNRTLPGVEGDLLIPEAAGTASTGSPAGARGWYRHTVYTSDPSTGYGAVSVPGLRPAGAGGGADGSAHPSAFELERALRRAAGRLRVLITDPAGGGSSTGAHHRIVPERR